MASPYFYALFTCPPFSHFPLRSSIQNELLLGKHAARWIKDCKQPDDLVYPGFIRYAKGVHATGAALQPTHNSHLIMYRRVRVGSPMRGGPRHRPLLPLVPAIVSAGGWGAQCLRHMSSVRSKEEMARKLPFLCGEGMGSYSVLVPAPKPHSAPRRSFGHVACSLSCLPCTQRDWRDVTFRERI